MKSDCVQQSRDYHGATLDGLVDERPENVEVTEAASTPLIEVAMSDSPNSRQLDVQPDRRNNFQYSSFKLQRSDLEEPSEATVVHASSLDDPDSNNFEFRLIPEMMSPLKKYVLQSYIILSLANLLPLSRILQMQGHSYRE